MRAGVKVFVLIEDVEAVLAALPEEVAPRAVEARHRLAVQAQLVRRAEERDERPAAAGARFTRTRR